MTFDHVVDADEIAALLAGRVAAGAFEQPDLALAAVLVEEMPDDRGHAALVRFARTVDVEVAEARDLRACVGQHAPHVLVEQELRIAVDVERRLAGALLAEAGTGAVHRGRRRVQERNVVVLAVLEQADRVAVVVGEHVAAVGLHRVRARALVQHRRDVVVEIAVGEAGEEFLLVEVLGDLAVDEVAELVAAREIVDGDDARLAARVERLDEIASR